MISVFEDYCCMHDVNNKNNIVYASCVLNNMSYYRKKKRKTNFIWEQSHVIEGKRYTVIAIITVFYNSIYSPIALFADLLITLII